MRSTAAGAPALMVDPYDTAVISQAIRTLDADADLRAWSAPPQVADCITWAVLPRDRVLRDYALDLVHALAPQIDVRDLRRVLEGNQAPNWPTPPDWITLSQPITL